MRLHDIKVYEINKTFYEFDGMSVEQTIQHITDTHRRSIDNNQEAGMPLPEMTRDIITYRFYIFNQIERESSWKIFLPPQIVREEDFNVQTASFVLFAIVDSKIFAIIGGSGMVVITRYLNHTFGLDLYEKLCDPVEDIVNSMEYRGVTGNLSSQKETYRNNHRLVDTISFTRIPTKINIQLRDVLVADVFDFLDFTGEEKAFAEIGKAFYIKCKISFDETHQLLLRIDEIQRLNQSTNLSRYELIRDENIRQLLRLDLCVRIRDDMMRRIPPGSMENAQKFDHDFIHPSKLEKFYECDTYKLFARNQQRPFFSTGDRSLLYNATLRYLYEQAEPNQNSFNYIISGIRVRGYRNNEEKTHAMFLHHLTCEIVFQGRAVFLLDDRWYKVRGDFVQAINDQCLLLMRANYWSNNVMRTWNRAIQDEGDYNLAYGNDNNFTVLDTMLGQNIELCDLMFEDETCLYLIHVKKGFNAKIRDLSNQIIISAARLWSDVKSGRYEFVDAVLESYNNSRQGGDTIPIQDFRNRFNKEIIYVMAFNSDLIGQRRIIDNLENIRSNIAKFCLVQGVKEIQSAYYPLKIFEIENI